MSEANNATCCICGKAYHVCRSCRDAMALNPWKTHTDTSEHYKIYQILRGYNIKLYDKAEAKARLQKVDLSDIDILRDHIRDLILDIMKEENQVVYETQEIHEVVCADAEPTDYVRPIRKRKSSKVVDTE